LLLKDVDDGVGRLAIYELVDDLMLNQAGPRSLLEFVQGGLKEGFQLWRGIERHGERVAVRQIAAHDAQIRGR
jgi:hypothetical protein